MTFRKMYFGEMKTLIMTVAALAMASAAVAQTATSTGAAETLTPKERKAKDAADLKAFKARQKEELAAFVASQKKSAGSAAGYMVEKPVMTNEDDSTAYLFGVMQSNGLKKYLTGQKGVDEAHLGVFAEAMIAAVNANQEDKDEVARAAGAEIGAAARKMTAQFSADYYAADTTKHVDPNMVAQGLLAGLFEQAGMTPDSASLVFQTIMTKRQAANKEALYGSNREAGEAFLRENAKKPGVVTTPTGLQYKVITQGAGEKPTLSQKVTVDYEGRLIDGTVFDSSYKRGEPTTFPLTQVIKGWTEALVLMPVGSVWEVYIPYQLGYGDRDMGGEIKPYSALIFKVELHSAED